MVATWWLINMYMAIYGYMVIYAYICLYIWLYNLYGVNAFDIYKPIPGGAVPVVEVDILPQSQWLYPNFWRLSP